MQFKGKTDKDTKKVSIGGWANTYNSEIGCNAFWTNMDNSYFNRTSYKWGMDPADLEQTIACSAARSFYSSYSYVKMKVDEPLIVRTGYAVYEGSST